MQQNASKSMQFQGSEKRFNDHCTSLLITHLYTYTITHHYTSHAVVPNCSKEPGASTTLQDFQAESPFGDVARLQIP